MSKIDTQREMARNTQANLQEAEAKLHSGNISNEQKQAIENNNENREDALQQVRNEIEEEKQL